MGYAYYPDGALQTQTNPNGTVAAYSYDNARRLTDVWNKPSASSTDAIARHQFTLDAVGNRTQVAETLAPILPPPLQPAPSGLPTGHGGTASTAPSGLPTGHPMTAGTAPSGLPNRPGPNTSPTTRTLSYGYDKLYRLTSASGGPAGATTYTYDPVGNRLTRTRNGATTTYAYDRADRITSATTPSSGTSYTVDAVGNMTARGSECLAYDQASRLKTLDTGCNSTTDASYAYDGDGKRASKTVGSTTTSYVYDANRGLPVLLEDGTRRYVWGLGLAYEVEGTAALVYHVDGLGSVRALTDSTKAVVQTYESDEFGIPISAQGGSGQPFGYTGEQRDSESGFLYLRSRMFDPTIGRFPQRDALPGQMTYPVSLNRYAYANSSPTNLIDPSGYSSTQQVLGETSEFEGGSQRTCPWCVIAQRVILFGQARISPYFSAGATLADGRPLSSVVPARAGQVASHIDDVASALRNGVLQAGDLVVRVFQYSDDVMVAINNRSFAALSRAGLRPTNVQVVDPSRSELRRLRETGVLGDTLPSTRIVVTPSRSDLSILDVITIPLDR